MADMAANVLLCPALTSCSNSIFAIDKSHNQIMSLSRIILGTKDIQRLTGRSERQARRILQAVRMLLGKQPRQPVSLREYCRYAGLSEEEVVRQLGLNK